MKQMLLQFFRWLIVTLQHFFEPVGWVARQRVSGCMVGVGIACFAVCRMEVSLLKWFWFGGGTKQRHAWLDFPLCSTPRPSLKKRPRAFVLDKSHLSCCFCWKTFKIHEDPRLIHADCFIRQGREECAPVGNWEGRWFHFTGDLWPACCSLWRNPRNPAERSNTTPPQSSAQPSVCAVFAVSPDNHKPISASSGSHCELWQRKHQF